MRISAIFDNPEAADAALRQVSQRVHIQGRQTTPLESRDYDTLAATLYPGMDAGSYFGLQSTGNFGQGIWYDSFPLPWLGSSFTRPEPVEHNHEMRLELDVAAEDLQTVENLLINQHGRSIQVY